MFLKYLALFFLGAFLSVSLFAMRSKQYKKYDLWIRKDGPIVIHSDQGTISKIQSFCNRVQSWQSNAHLLVIEDIPSAMRNYDGKIIRKVLVWRGVLRNISPENAEDLLQSKGGYVNFCTFENHTCVTRETIGVFVIGLKNKNDLRRPGMMNDIKRVVLEHECCLCNIL